MRSRISSRVTRSLVFSFVGSFLFLSSAIVVFAQRRVDQGLGATSTIQYWPMRLCDSSGNCVLFVAGLVPVTGTVTATPIGTQAVSGTIQANAGTGTFNMTCISGCGGAASFLDTAAFSFGVTPINNMGAVVDDVATNTVAENAAAAPRMSANRVLFFDLKNTQTNTAAITVTGTVAPSGTTTVAGTLTGVTGTMQANAGTGTLAVNVITGTIGNTVTISPTGTQAISLAQVLGAALTTANPVISGGRAATDTTASVANGSAVAQALDRYGRSIIVFAPQELWATANNFILTATTASAVLAAPGANYRWAITGWWACDTNTAAAARVDILDGTTQKDSFQWSTTATTGGEPRCPAPHLFNPPFLMTANTAVNVQSSTAVTDIRGVITGFKTGT